MARVRGLPGRAPSRKKVVRLSRRGEDQMLWRAHAPPLRAAGDGFFFRKGSSPRFERAALSPHHQEKRRRREVVNLLSRHRNGVNSRSRRFSSQFSRRPRLALGRGLLSPSECSTTRRATTAPPRQTSGPRDPSASFARPYSSRYCLQTPPLAANAPPAGASQLGARDLRSRHAQRRFAPRVTSRERRPPRKTP